MLGKGGGEVGDLAELRMIHPCIEYQTERAQRSEPGTERAVQEHFGRWDDFVDVGIPGGRLPDAREAPAAGDHVTFQQRLRAVAEHQIDPAHHARADARGAKRSAGSHGRHAGDEFGFAERLFFLGPGGAIHRVAFLEHRRDHVVAAGEVGQQFRHQIDVPVARPQMMVRIDDRQIRVQDGFGVPVQPVLVDLAGEAAGGLGHTRPPCSVMFAQLFALRDLRCHPARFAIVVVPIAGSGFSTPSHRYSSTIRSMPECGSVRLSSAPGAPRPCGAIDPADRPIRAATCGFDGSSWITMSARNR